MRVAVDIGGTFTDLVLLEPDTPPRVAKCLTNPTDLSAAVLDALANLAVRPATIAFFVHGTTAGLNTFLERRGAHVALITTRGFRDVYEIGRGDRPDMYNLHFRKPKRLVERRDIFEIGERLDATGSVVQPIRSDELQKVAGEILRGPYESVAVCFLHAYLDDRHERRVLEEFSKEDNPLPVSLSSVVAPEWREFERTSTTVLNAYIAPALGSYLEQLAAKLTRSGMRSRVFVMQSSGGVTPATTIGNRAVHTLMSGPVGGAIGGAAVSEIVEEPNLLCVDMGGTSFDMSLIVGGAPTMRAETELGGFPVLAPMVDIHTIGAGGGSVAWLEGDGLRVGPRSAGAVPGPVCYGRGGTEPTVTDANLVLGRLNPSDDLGGEIRLDVGAAAAALADLGRRLGLSAVEAADGICTVVTAKMAGAIRRITVEKGIDPRDFALLAFGGAGPLHASLIARELGISTVVIPPIPGAFSAWGMLQTDIRLDRVRSFLRQLPSMDAGEFRAVLDAIARDAQHGLETESIPTENLVLQFSADMRYVGQEHFLTLELPSDDGLLASSAMARLFHAAHETRYGHANVHEDVEIVNLRCAAIVPTERQPLNFRAAHRDGELAPHQERPVYIDRLLTSVPVYKRSLFRTGDRLTGPAIIEEASSTTLLLPGDVADVDRSANLVVGIDVAKARLPGRARSAVAVP